MQPLQSKNWYISRAYGHERLGPSHVYLIEIIALIQLFNVPKLFDYSDIYFFFYKCGFGLIYVVMLFN